MDNLYQPLPTSTAVLSADPVVTTNVPVSKSNVVCVGLPTKALRPTYLAVPFLTKMLNVCVSVTLVY